MSGTSLAHATSAREVYERCGTYDELLDAVKRTKLRACRRLAHAIRNYKSRHPLLLSHQAAFERHRQLTLHPTPRARKRCPTQSIESSRSPVPPPSPTFSVSSSPSSPPPQLLPAPSQPLFALQPVLHPDVHRQLASLQQQMDALQSEMQRLASLRPLQDLPSSPLSSPLLSPPLTEAAMEEVSPTAADACIICRVAKRDIRLLPCRHDAFCGECWAKQLKHKQGQHRAHLRRYPHHDKSPLLVLCPVCSQPTMSCESVRPQGDEMDKMKEEVASLRGLMFQRSTPSPLTFKLVHSRHSKSAQVLSIVGDGRCLFYSLLQSQRAVLPLASEADELRQRLRAHLSSSYTDAEWEQRVPAHMRDTLCRQRFGELYLARDTAHVPLDVVALWQDMTQCATDVYMLGRTLRDSEWVETVEHVPCRSPATNAIVLLLTWRGVGHYEVVTYNGVISLPRTHDFTQHLDQLHQLHVAALHNKEQRRAVRRQRRPEECAEDDVIE